MQSRRSGAYQVVAASFHCGRLTSPKDQGVCKMFAVRRLLAVGTVLSLAAVVASSHLWGEPGPGKGPNIHGSTGLQKPADPAVAEEPAPSRFADRPLVLYRTAEGETLMALQLKPKLSPAAARPRDYLVLIDTAASMANGPLVDAQKLTKA